MDRMKGTINMAAVILTMVTVLVATTTTTRSELDDHRCGPCFDCRTCNPNRCCSVWGFCEDDIPGTGSCPDAHGCNSNNCDDRNQAANSTFTSVYGSDLKAARGHNNCSSSNYHSVNISLIQGGQNPFCPKQGESDAVDSEYRACGQCLKMTQRKTGAQTTVRLPTTQECSSNEHSELGNIIFEELDTDGEGAARGYLNLDYQVVRCDHEQP